MYNNDNIFDNKEDPFEMVKYKEIRKHLFDGPWMDEPDHVEFKSHGMPCILMRSLISFTWCGYVALSKNHPYFKKDYNKIPVKVHGGLTFGSHFLRPDINDENLYWIGFDCGHLFDFLPIFMSRLKNDITDHHDLFRRLSSECQYRTFDYAMEQVINLAKQMSQVKTI